MRARICILILLAISLLLTSAFPAWAGVFIVIYTQEKDTGGGHGNPDLDIGRHIAKLERQFPKSQFLSIRGDSNKEIRQKLKGLIFPTDRIDGILIDAHGNSDAEISTSDGDFFVDLEDRKSVRETFGPVIGKFTSGARIVFTSCNLAKMSDDKAVARRFQEVARNFALKSGSIYMNYTVGSETANTAYQQPFYEMPSADGKVVALVLQAFWPLTLPITWTGDQIITNRGYTYIADKSGERLIVDNFFRARTEPAHVTERKAKLLWHEASDHSGGDRPSKALRATVR